MNKLSLLEKNWLIYYNNKTLNSLHKIKFANDHVRTNSLK